MREVAAKMRSHAHHTMLRGAGRWVFQILHKIPKSHPLWEGDGLPLADPPSREERLVVRQAVHQQAPAKGPDAGKHKVVLQEPLVRRRCPTRRLL